MELLMQCDAMFRQFCVKWATMVVLSCLLWWHSCVADGWISVSSKLADLTKLDPEFRQSCVRQATMVGSVLLRVSGCFAGLLLEISEQVGSRAPAC